MSRRRNKKTGAAVAAPVLQEIYYASFQKSATCG